EPRWRETWTKPLTSAGPSSRCMANRETPSFNCGAMVASAASARAPPVVLSQTMPTWCPRAAWPLATSRMWRKMPPTGVRVTCTIFRVLGSGIVKPAFGDFDGVAGADRVSKRQRAARRHALDFAGDGDLVLRGARREAAGDGDGILDRHVRHVGVLAGEGYLAEDEERPIGLDLDRNARVADKA